MILSCSKLPCDQESPLQCPLLCQSQRSDVPRDDSSSLAGEEESVVRWGTEVPRSSVFGRCFTTAPPVWGRVDLGYFVPRRCHLPFSGQQPGHILIAWGGATWPRATPGQPPLLCPLPAASGPELCTSGTLRSSLHLRCQEMIRGLWPRERKRQIARLGILLLIKKAVTIKPCPKYPENDPWGGKGGFLPWEMPFCAARGGASRKEHKENASEWGQPSKTKQKPSYIHRAARLEEERRAGQPVPLRT